MSTEDVCTPYNTPSASKITRTVKQCLEHTWNHGGTVVEGGTWNILYLDVELKNCGLINLVVRNSCQKM